MDRIEFDYMQCRHSIELLDEDTVMFGWFKYLNPVHIKDDMKWAIQFQKTQIKSIGGANGFMKLAHEWIDDGFGVGFFADVCKKATLEVRHSSDYVKDSKHCWVKR